MKNTKKMRQANHILLVKFINNNQGQGRDIGKKEIIM